MADRFRGWLDLDFDVVSQAVQALHQLAFGQIGEVAAQQAGNLRLRDTHAPGSLFLSQVEATHGPCDLDGQAGLDPEFVGVRQTQIGKYVAGTRLDLDAVNHALSHAASPLPAPRLLSAWRE